MSQKKIKIIQREFLKLSALVIVLTVFGVAYTAAGSDSATINFSATFVGGGCDISTTVTQVTFNGGEAVKPADIISSPPKESFDVVLRNCAGWGLLPKITVSGESTMLYGPPLFRDPMPISTSEGYGVLLSTVGNGTFGENLNLAKNSTIQPKNWNKDTPLSSIDNILPITAELTCGNCDYNGRHRGDLSAAVTFNFVYD